VKTTVIRAGLSFCAALALAGCARREAAPSPAADPVLRVSQRNEPEDLDPATAGLPDDFFVIRALGEGLVVPTPEGQAPGAADRWDISADGLTYTFRLRAGARWSDGEPVTAEDFLESFKRVLTPSTAAPKAELFYPVANARVAFADQILPGLFR